MPKHDVLYFHPDPIEEVLSNLEKYTADSEAIKKSEVEYERMFANMASVAYFEKDGIFQSWHVTDNPFIMENALAKGQDLVRSRTIGSRMCPGFAVTQNIHPYVFHSGKRWSVIKTISQEDIEKTSAAIRTQLISQVTTGYITQTEYNHAQDALTLWVNQGNDYGPTMVGGQPYNIDVPNLVKALGIADPIDPSIMIVYFEGRYLDMTDREVQEEAYYLASLVLKEPLEKMAIEDVCSVLRRAGWDGVYNRATMGLRAELIIWNVDKILRFGAWEKNKKPSLSGAYKSRPQRVKLEFVYDCPAKGRVQFTIWPRKGEMQEDTGRRGLKDLMRLDEPQIPYCRKIYAKYIE